MDMRPARNRPQPKGQRDAEQQRNHMADGSKVRAAGRGHGVAQPPSDPDRAPLCRYRGGECAQDTHRAVTHPHVGGVRERHRQPSGGQGGGQPHGHDQRGTDMAECECDDQTTAAPDEFAQAQQADQARKPKQDVAAVADEGAADQRDHVAMHQIVQVGAHLADRDVVRVRTQDPQQEGHREQRGGVDERGRQRGRQRQQPQSHRCPTIFVAKHA